MACFLLPPSGNAVPASFLLEAGGEDFVEALSAHNGFPSERILPVNSGAAALYVALRGLSALEPARRGVAIPAWCCPSVPQTVIQAGLEPVLVDLDPATLGYDEAALAAARDRGLLAVVLVHFFGLARPRPAGDWAGTVFLRDCAQDFDHRMDPGDDAPCFYSFGRGKALNAGHGGALCLPAAGPLLDACRNALEALPASHDRVLPKALAINLLSGPRLFWALSRMPFLGIGETVWKRPLVFTRLASGFPSLGSACLEAYLQRRPFYRKLTAGYKRLIEACDAGRIGVPVAAPSAAGLPMRFPVLVRDPDLREALYRGVTSRFGGVTRMYPEILPCIQGAPEGLAEGRGYPGAESVARAILTLPVTAEMMGCEQAFLDCLKGILEREGALGAYPEPASSPEWIPVRDWAPLRPSRRSPSLFPSP
jgi:hypothetical protein